MGIAVPDTAVASVDEKFGSLVASDLAPGIYGVPLCAVNGRGALATGASHSPSALVRYDMLVTFAHLNLLILNDNDSVPPYAVQS